VLLNGSQMFSPDPANVPEFDFDQIADAKAVIIQTSICRREARA
jgi:hypothetical protein